MFPEFKIATTPVEFIEQIQKAQKEFFDAMEKGVSSWRAASTKTTELAFAPIKK